MGAERASLRPLTLSVVAALVSAAATGGVIWGVLSHRVDANEKGGEKTADTVQVHDRQIASIMPQLEDMKKQLDRIEGKFDRSRERDQ